MAACLRPGGTLLLQNRNFDAVMAEKNRWLGTQSHQEDEQEWLFLRFYDFDPDGLITFNHYPPAQGMGPAVDTAGIHCSLISFNQEILLPLLESAGFHADCLLRADGE